MSFPGEKKSGAAATVFQPAFWEKVYIFISSTFNDMHAERDYLVKKVFPQLSDWCEARRLRMVDIDLRWGVTEQDATRNQNVVQVCLQRIDECRPFFLCLLGQRYGWVPRRREVSASTFDDFPGLAEAVDEGRSVTELEILHAVVRPFTKGPPKAPPEYTLFYQRHPVSLRHIPRDPTQLWRTFTDAAEPNPASRRFLLARRRHLRKVTLPASGRPVIVYRGDWNTKARSPEVELPLRSPAVLPENIERWRRQWREAGVRVEGLNVADLPGEEEKARRFNARLTTGRLGNFRVGGNSFASRVVADLQAAIEARFPSRAPECLDSPLATELAQQAQFHFAATEGFVERAGDFEALDKYARSASDRPFVLTAPGGAGKSMLLARWVERERAARSGGKDAALLYRFVGASDQSTTVTNLIALLLAELKERTGRIGDELPSDPSRLRQVWPDLLARVGEGGRLVVVIDSLDQLHSGLTDLTWVPRRLPPDVRFIVSFRRDARRGDEAVEYFRQAGALMAEVPPFVDLEDRRRLVRAYLAQYLKELDESHVEALIRSPGALNPLFLKVALSELRVFGAFASLATKIEDDFGATPESAFRAVFRRLETDPSYSAIEPATAVPLIFGLLAHARRGLAGDEIAAMLCTALGHDPKDSAAREGAVDATHLFLRQVRPFLARRQGRVDFFYETFRLAATARFVAGGEASSEGARPAPAWHALLADHFHTLPLWIEAAGDGPRPNERKVGELPYHLTLCRDGKRLEKVLTELEFIEAKCAAGQTNDLVEDYARVTNSLRTVPIGQFADFVRNQAHVLTRWPELTFQQAANTARADIRTGQSAPAKAASYRQVMGLESRPWIRRLNPTPSAGACLMTLAGHGGSAIAVVVSPDGERAISAGADRTLRVWDLRTGGAMEVVRDLFDGTAGLALIPGTTLVAVPSLGGRIVLWDFEHLQPAGELEGPRYGVSCLAADASGRWLAAGTSAVPVQSTEGEVNSVVLYDLQSFKAVDIGPFTRGVNALALSRDASSLVCASEYVLQALDRSARAVTATARASGERVSRLLFGLDDHTIVSGAWGGDIQIWRGPSWQLVRTMQGRQGIVQDVAFRPDGVEVAGAGIEGSIAIWGVADAKSRTILRGHTGPVTSLTYKADGSRLVSSSADGTVRVWDPNFDRDYFKAARNRLTVWGDAPAPGFKAYGVPDPHGIHGSQEFDLEIGEAMLRSLGQGGSRAKSGDLDRGRAAGDVEGILYALSSMRKHFNLVTLVDMTSSGRLAVTASLDDTVRTWDFETGTCQHWLEGHNHGIFGLAVSADGLRIASGDRAATIKVWDAQTAQEIASRTIASPNPEFDRGGTATERVFNDLRRPTISPLRFAAGDRLLLSADSLDPAIKAWDASTLELRFTLAGHRARVRSLLAVADGRRLISASEDGVLIVWDLMTGRLLVRGGSETAGNIAGGLGAIGLTGDGHIACAWPDETLRLLDPDTLAGTAVLRGSEGRIASVSASGRLVAATRALEGGTIVDVWRGSEAAPVLSQRLSSEHVSAVCERGGERVAIGGPGESLTIYDFGADAPTRRFPVEVSCLAFASGRIVAGNDIGDVFLLELSR